MRVCLFMMAACSLGLATPVTAQTRPTSVVQRRLMDMARFVPESAGLFVSIHQPIKLDKALARTRAVRLLPAITGQMTSPDTTLDLRDSLRKYVRVNSSIDVDELMNTDVALIAPSWDDISQAHFLIRLKDPSVLDRWFPPEKRRRDSTLGEATFINLNDGLFVCIHGQYIVLARRSASRSLLRDTQRLMIRAKRQNLAALPAFREMLVDLKDHPLATVFLSSKPISQGKPTLSSSIWPSSGYSMLSLYEGDDQLDVVLHTTPIAKTNTPSLSAQALMAFRRLPHSTLFAAATTVDFDSFFDSMQESKGNQWVQRYLSLLSGVAGEETPSRTLFDNLGEDVMVVWGQTLTVEGTIPQIALMMRTKNARKARAEVTRTIANVLKLAALLDPVDQRRSPLFKLKTHLGSPIVYIPLSEYASQSRFSFLSLLRNADPAWATYEDWLIVALSSNHIESILDAQLGLAPRLSSVPSMANALPVKPGQRSLAVAQLELASYELDCWLDALDAGAPSLLSPSWWNIPVSKQGWPNVLGIEVDDRGEDGAIWVMGVRPGSTAAKVILKNDRILAVDDEVLNLKQPYQDFQDRLSQVGVTAPYTFRILRGSAIIEVQVAANQEMDHTNSRSFVPADAVRAIASIGKALHTATLSVQTTTISRQTTRVSLHFTGAPTP